MRGLAIATVVGVVALALGLLLASGGGGGGEPASNYRSRVASVEPAVPGLEIRPVELGTSLELVNRTGRTVTVLGYQREPYLRIGADGVHENVRSPSLYLDGGDPPPDTGPEAAPRWERVDGGTSVVWHDHRAHWMGRADPPEVAAQPDRTHLVTAWEVPLLVDGTPVTVTGRLTWVPGPSPWPWYLGALAVAGLVVGLALTPWRRGVAPAVLAGLVVAAAVHTAGVSTEVTGGLIDRLGLLGLPLLAVAPAAFALVAGRHDERNRWLLGGATIAGLGGLVGASHVAWLDRSQLPTGLDPTLARLVVAVALGLAGGGLVLVAWRVRALWGSGRRPDRRSVGDDVPAMSGS